MKKKAENKNRPRVSELLFEIIAELAISLVFLLVGAGAFWLFGKQDALESIDWDALVLIGVAVLLVAFYVASAIVNLIKKRKKKDTQNPEMKE